MIDNREVGKKIAAMRQEKNLTQQQLASILNVSHQAVSKWEGGQALPDIQTMQELTRFFGMTVDQLIASADAEAAEGENAENAYEAAAEETMENDPSEIRKEKGKMSIQQLLQMAPYMSKETVEEIVMEIEDHLSASQIARIAPYLRPETVEELMQKHQPDLSWESLRRIAPYLRREFVDDLARNIANGKETIKPAADNFNKTINDIGKAFDDMGREMKHAVKKGLRFGKRVIREVSSSISEMSNEEEAAANEASGRSERAQALRKRAFERAAEDGNWDWLSKHIGELEGDPELRARIAAKAKEAGREDWICETMGDFADAEAVNAAIETANWAWLSEKAWQLDPDLQEKIARAAAEQENWAWLKECSDQMCIADCALEIARGALNAGEAELAVQLAENHLKPDGISALAEDAYNAGALDALDSLLTLAEDETIDRILIALAENKTWDRIEKHVQNASGEAVERLMEIAVEQGNFDAVDILDQHLA